MCASTCSLKTSLTIDCAAESRDGGALLVTYGLTPTLYFGTPCYLTLKSTKNAPTPLIVFPFGMPTCIMKD
jgi:hypothetical protein